MNKLKLLTVEILPYLSVMSTFKDRIMIPDQGGWIGFKKMAEFLGIESNSTFQQNLVL